MRHTKTQVHSSTFSGRQGKRKMTKNMEYSHTGEAGIKELRTE